jgi:hypothetical protein
MSLQLFFLYFCSSTCPAEETFNLFTEHGPHISCSLNSVFMPTSTVRHRRLANATFGDKQYIKMCSLLIYNWRWDIFHNNVLRLLGEAGNM